MLVCSMTMVLDQQFMLSFFLSSFQELACIAQHCSASYSDEQEITFYSQSLQRIRAIRRTHRLYDDFVQFCASANADKGKARKRGGEAGEKTEVARKISPITATFR